jgi:hypothetical protein
MDNLEFSILSERCAPDKRGHDGSVGADRGYNDRPIGRVL